MSTTTEILLLCIATLLLSIGVIANAIHGILMNRALNMLRYRVDTLEYIERKRWLK